MSLVGYHAVRLSVVCLSLNSLVWCLFFVLSLRRLEELQSQLSEEKEKVAHSTEQLQQEKSRKAQELMETRDAHQSQISGLQETIANLVSIVSQSQQCQCVGH